MQRKQEIISVLFLAVFLLAVPAAVTHADAVTVPLKDRVVLGTYSIYSVDQYADVDDYMLNGKQVYFPMGEEIDSGTGETAAQTGTSYVDLSKSTVIGNYGSGANPNWADYAFTVTDGVGTVVEGGDTYINATSGTSSPGLSAGVTDSYMTMTADYTTASSDGGSTAEYIYYPMNVWEDKDGDGTDDSVAGTVASSEDYLDMSQNTYIYFCGEVTASDTDVAAYGIVDFSFYTGGSDNYDVAIVLDSKTSSSYTHTWTYTDATLNGLDVESYVTFFECNSEYVAFIIDLADLCSDDTDSSPNISGLDTIYYEIATGDDYGDGTADTVTLNVENLAIFNALPAITDNVPANTIDWNGGATNAAIGDGTYYASHDVLCPYVAAAADNDFTTYIYLEDNIESGTSLLNYWHQIYFGGQAELKAASGSVTTQTGSNPNVRTVDLNFDFNQLRISDGKEISTTLDETYSTAAFYITTDKDDLYSDALEFDNDIVSAAVGGVDATDDFTTNLVNVADATAVALYTWTTAPDSGVINVHYIYNTEEGQMTTNNPLTNINVNGWFSGLGNGIVAYKWWIIGALGGITLLLLVISRKKKR